ncbi:MAG: sulfatase-like hydrolase/transferase, partial [Desulfobacterales bacterium]
MRFTVGLRSACMRRARPIQIGRPEQINTGNIEERREKMKKTSFFMIFAFMATLMLNFGSALAANEKPNILVIWGDDIGITNISAYSRGMMGYKTPNIDRIANEGALFTDYYAEQSCTAGRAGFITGQIPFRTGLTKV